MWVKFQEIRALRLDDRAGPGALRVGPQALESNAVGVEGSDFSAFTDERREVRRLVPRRRAAVHDLPPNTRLERHGGQAARLALQDNLAVTDHRVVVEVGARFED